MKITSADIKKHEFEKSFRGYNVDEVNHFLSSLAQEWDKMLNEAKMLKMQLEISEKEASKLKEVESTLIKTLKTAEDTSNSIKESAQFEATKKLDEANYQAQKTINEANALAASTIERANNEAAKTIEEANLAAEKTITEANELASSTIEKANATAKQIIFEAESKRAEVLTDANTQVQAIQAEGQNELNKLEAQYNTLSLRKNELIAKLKSYQFEIAQLIDGNYEYIAPEPVVATNILTDKVSDKISIETFDIEIPQAIEEPIEEVVPVVENLTSPEFDNHSEIIEEEEEEEFAFSLPSAVNDINEESRTDESSNLELIEGIGPKIKEILYNAGIKDFRSLAITPEYRLRDILNAAGPHFAAHDPSTWNEQAMLASKGQWDELEALKSKLVAGRAPKIEPIVESSQNTVASDGTNTEDMLEKVNKVKAAIRKAMVEGSNVDKSDSKPQGGSFFDRL